MHDASRCVIDQGIPLLMIYDSCCQPVDFLIYTYEIAYVIFKSSGSKRMALQDQHLLESNILLNYSIDLNRHKILELHGIPVFCSVLATILGGSNPSKRALCKGRLHCWRGLDGCRCLGEPPTNGLVDDSKTS